MTIIIEDSAVLNGSEYTINEVNEDNEELIEIIVEDDEDDEDDVVKHNNDTENDTNGNTEIPPEPPDIIEFIDSSDDDDNENEKQIHTTNGICELNDLEADLLNQQKAFNLNGEKEIAQHFAKGPMIIQCTGGVDLDTGRNEFSCDYCHQKFISKYDWEIHKRSHSSYKPYKCFICERIFHGNAKHLCYPQDGQIFESNLLNFPETEYILPNNVQSTQNNNKNKNIEKQADNKLTKRRTFKVVKGGAYNSVIENRLNNSTEDQSNNSIEEQQTSYNCRRCSAKFPNETLLEFHQQVHRFRCNFCGLACRTMAALTKHIARHQGPYDCDQCRKSFVRIFNLNRHKENAKHDPNYIAPPEVLCSVCSKSFRKLTSLTKHMLTHDIKPHYCEICKLYFSHKNALESHMSLHV